MAVAKEEDAMTTEDMRVEIESVMTSVLAFRKPSAKVGQAVPEGVTPLSWHVAIATDAENATPEQFRERYADPAGQALASMGLDHGCTSFAHLRVQDRESVKVASQGGRGIPRKRERAFIVHALGWGHKQSEYSHTPVWPHAMGQDVPAASKGESK